MFEAARDLNTAPDRGNTAPDLAPALIPELAAIPHLHTLAQSSTGAPGTTGVALPRPAARPAWSRAELAGRLCELSTAASGAVLTVAFHLVLDAQLEGEPVAWVSATDGTFFPPDAAAGGVDLAALVVVRVPDARAAGRAADRLLRSGAFGLVVLDLGAGANLPVPLQGRLVQLAGAHDAAVLCLTEKGRDAPSLGSLVSLHGRARRRRRGADRYACGLSVTKDKRHGPGWNFGEVYRGPDGLC